MEKVIVLLSGLAGFLFFISLLGFVYFRGTALLQFYQQEEYDTDRFLKWVWKRKGVDKKATLIVLIGFLLWFFLRDFNPAVLGLIFYILVLAGLVIGIQASRKTSKSAKKPLVMTPRANRILYIYILLVGFYFGGIMVTFNPGNYAALTFAFLFFFQCPPFFLGGANFILKPVEERINDRYLRQAQEKMKGLNPTIIAITGSYGKTSIKHILAHILGASAPTLATPGSVNTPMGVVRIIREKLNKTHKYFVVEMGAYGPGSIERLCEITPPDLGIISAVGLAHFERFKSLKAVFSTKFELADALKKSNGEVIVNTAAIDTEYLKEYLEKNDHVVLCEGDADFSLNSYSQTRTGLEIHLQIIWKGKKQDLKINTPLYGPHQATNILLASVAALKLGIAPDIIRAALKTMPQISHRLEVTSHKGGLTVIDDAYNSNPTGFASALDLLETLKKPSGRAILLTPGMVELGKEHNHQHKILAKKAAGIVDLALVVGPGRMASFIDGFQAVKGKNGVLYTFKTQDDAEKWLFANGGPEDVVLIENNLPDIYEAEVGF